MWVDICLTAADLAAGVIFPRVDRLFTVEKVEKPGDKFRFTVKSIPRE